MQIIKQNTTGKDMIGHEDMVFERLITEILAKDAMYDVDAIRKAYLYAKDAHSGQYRLSGEPYIIHSIETARNLISITLDLEAIQAALLHDVIEDTQRTKENVEQEFGIVVSKLATGVEKVTKIRYTGEERQVESLRKMFLAMVDDLRVIFIKLSDRIHNMETLKYHPKPEKRKRIAEETLKIYVPIAERLGIYHFKTRLEDLSFAVLWPTEYKQLEEYMDTVAPQQKEKLDYCISEISQLISRYDIDAQVIGRVKNLYSIYQKMLRKKLRADDMYDIFAIRIITNEKTDCYAILGIIHEYYTPIIKRIKDYIAVPKPNGYQSIHTTVLGLLKDTPVEVQIRTENMHSESEYGVAAHYFYKEKGSGEIAKSNDWILRIAQLESDYTEFKKSLEMEFFKDRIFVLTPDGDIKDLPISATPVDFAYAIHTDIGDKTLGAKINGSVIPLSQPLSSGDIVQIITRNNASPSADWLKWVKTRHAKTCIKKYLNSRNKEKNLTIGISMLNKRLRTLGIEEVDSSLHLLKIYDDNTISLEEREKLIEGVALGSISISTLLRKTLKDEYKANIPKHTRKKKKDKIKNTKKEDIYIFGEKDIEYHLANCCKPVSANQIVAFITTSGISIHRKDCKRVNAVDQTRVLPASWAHDTHIAEIDICISNDTGIIAKLIDIIQRDGVQIVSMHTRKSLHFAGCIDGEIDIQYYNIEQLDDVMDRLSTIGDKISKMGIKV